jgi:uncharacterized membrane protein
MGQHFADVVAGVIRSWFFVFTQMFFIGGWVLINHYLPFIAWDNKSFDILRLVLTIESSFIGSILLMNQHYQSEKDRKVVYSDYYIDLQIRQELREMRPLLEKIYKNSDKNQ